MKKIFKRKTKEEKMETGVEKNIDNIELNEDLAKKANTTAEETNGSDTNINDDKKANEGENAEKMSQNNEQSEPVNVEEELKKQIEELKDKYLRLSAEFDNYRKRTMKERMDLIKNASEEVLVNILPVMDNFERAMKAMEIATEIEPVKEGITLIYSNFKDFLSQKGIKEIEAQNQDFNTDFHEAITRIPVQDKAMAGKVFDVIQKGYFLNEKVVRYAKVVVGENSES
jgi:molecular chaperone GrpE